MQLKIPPYVIKYDSLWIKLKKIKALWNFNHTILRYYFATVCPAPLHLYKQTKLDKFERNVVYDCFMMNSIHE